MIRTTKTKTTLLLSMLGALALSASAWGQGAPAQGMMDSNGDGMISAKEHAAGAKMMFDRMDANRDGYVTAAEMDAGRHAMMMKDGAGMQRGRDMPAGAMPAGGMAAGGMAAGGMRPAGMMSMMDSDGDGAVSAQEHAAHTKMMFDRMDTNHDGKITAAEMSAGQGAGHEMMMGGNAGMHRPDGMPGMGPPMSTADRIKKMDSNGDGKVSAAEHAAGAQATFNEVDTNKDGNLSRSEMAAHRAAMGKHGMQQDMDADAMDGK